MASNGQQPQGEWWQRISLRERDKQTARQIIEAKRDALRREMRR